MPKYRQLHTKIIDSFDFNEMPDDFTRVVWMLLMVILDREGRGIDDVGWIKSKMFPLRKDVTPEKLGESFDWLAEKKMIVRYQVNGHKYFFVPTFKDYQSGTQKEAESLLPGPPDPLQDNSRVTPELLQSCSGVDPEEVRAAESASASESESESAFESESERPEIFGIYEREFGLLTPMIAEALIEAEGQYPKGWLPAAFKECVSNNKRSWAYAKAILARWKVDGFQANSQKNGHGHSPGFDPMAEARKELLGGN